MRSLVTACLALSACTAAPPPVAHLEAPIIAGSDDSGDPGIVELLANVPGQPTASECTAAVISPHVLLTAGHCVSADSVGAGALFFVFTNQVNGPKTRPQLMLDEVHAHPMWKLLPLGAGNAREPYDIAVGIVRSTTFPAPPISYNHGSLAASNVGRQVRIVGYGINAAGDAGADSAGTRRSGNMKISAIEDLYVSLTGDRNSTCHGDSGGPALLPIAGKEAIVGVTSVGPESCDPNVGGIDTNTSTFSDFIDGWVDQLDPRGSGQLGDACGSNRDCASLVCGQSGDKSFCSASCDPSAKDSCPAAYPCSEVDGEHFCMPPHSGCDLAAGGAPAPAPGMSALWLLVALGYTLRKVRSSGRPKCSSSTRTASIIERMPHR